MVGLVQEIDNSEILEAARAVPCIEVIDGPAPEGARPEGKAYYPDQHERLTRKLRELSNRFNFLVAICQQSGLVRLYRRPRQ